MGKSSYKVFTESLPAEKEKLLQKAATTYRATLKKAPLDVNSMHVLGLIECQLGQLTAAVELFQRALILKPDFVDVLFLYGLALMEQQKYLEALAAFQRAHALAPSHAEISYNLGCAFFEMRRYSEAAVIYQQVLALNPTHSEALNNLGNMAHDQGRFEEAVNFYRRVLAHNASHVMAHNNIAVSLTAMGDFESAERHLRTALSLKADYAEAHNNLGNVFKMRGQFSESKACYEKALSLWPDYSEAQNNLGNALKDCGSIDAAIAFYERSLRLKDNADYHHNLALAYLAVGRFDEGWREYEVRWQTKQHAAYQRTFIKPQWHGEQASGQTLLIHAEQGFGDTLQFCRYAEKVKGLGLKVIMEVQPALASLITSLQGVDQVIAHGQELPSFDLHCPMLSLPHVFKTNLKTIPASIPYLGVPSFAVKTWQEKLPKAQSKSRVGLVWAGNGRGQTEDFRAVDRQRSIRPELLAPLMELSRFQYYSLQKGGLPPPAAFHLINFMEDCHSFADTAALICNLDLVISVDTAVAHLAGALGKPVWLLNRYNNCWRWLQNRNDSPWYPTMRLFRQSAAGDWESVIGEVRLALQDFKTGF